MKTLFTLHAGEVIAGEHIQHEYKNVKVWVPAKDTGVDLLVTGKDYKKALALQVKFSKDHLSTKNTAIRKKLRSYGWFTLDRRKIKSPLAPADYWIFVLYGFESNSYDFVIIPPDELLRRIDAINRGEKERCDVRFWVTKGTTKEEGQCWDTNLLLKEDQLLIAEGEFKDKDRNFGEYLNNWSPIENLNGPAR
ncbi:MAG: hypothetical protein M3R43_09190 [Acidobacteriota bacterium]|nr:hypothetical protein [Acidobacteriota bacterium]